MGEFTFVTEKICPICAKSTHVAKAKSRLVAEKTDPDFCVHYKDFNPYYYRIWFCEHCGFAADEKTFLGKIPQKQKEKIWGFLNKNKLSFEFAEERDLPDAVASYMLAIYFAEMVGRSLNYQANLHLTLAWVYRLADDKKSETLEMQKAASLYEKSLMRERYPIENMTDTMALYLAGAIHYMLSDMDMAAQYLSRIIGDKNARTAEPKLFEQARDLWQQIREETSKPSGTLEEKKQGGRRR